MTEMVQLPFPGSELGQLFVCANCAVAEMLVMLTAVDCVFVSVAVCAGLVEPEAVVGKASDVGENRT